MFGKKKKEANPIIEVKKANMLIFIAYLILGIYFVNKQFTFIKIPEQIIQFDNWITFTAGIFLLLGAFNYWKSKK
ncbi:MAG: hypothetical protein ABFQ65_02115 [Nanoarchaeota archaeon]